MYVCIYMCVYTHTHTHTNTQTHTHTHIGRDDAAALDQGPSKRVPAAQEKRSETGGGSAARKDRMCSLAIECVLLL